MKKLLILILLVSILTSCTKNEDSITYPIVGVWNFESANSIRCESCFYQMTLNIDSTLLIEQSNNSSINSYLGRYRINDKRFIMYYDNIMDTVTITKLTDKDLWYTYNDHITYKFKRLQQY